MSSVSEMIIEETTDREPITPELTQFTRLEKMLFFAVVSECERCARSEGADCFSSMRRVDCPFHSIREKYDITDIETWKEMMR